MDGGVIDNLHFNLISFSFRHLFSFSRPSSLDSVSPHSCIDYLSTLISEPLISSLVATRSTLFHPHVPQPPPPRLRSVQPQLQPPSIPSLPHRTPFCCPEPPQSSTAISNLDPAPHRPRHTTRPYSHLLTQRTTHPLCSSTRPAHPLARFASATAKTQTLDTALSRVTRRQATVGSGKYRAAAQHRWLAE
ncbi:uncharacterized protein BKA78DRAFT_131927 [Phyllosticta capitalensis]|uniref:uncharacterized protein n=1 Tax=Phyllosticta capitalensis TaxID=121624 RepID=UPI00312F6518